MIETGNFVQLKEYLNQSRSNTEPQDEVGVTVGGPGSNSYYLTTMVDNDGKSALQKTVQMGSLSMMLLLI